MGSFWRALSLTACSVLIVSGQELDPLESLRQTVPGEPGQDYPIYAAIPESAFSCQDKTFGGFYADPELDCQVFHICMPDVDNGDQLTPVSFLCPNGTIFNQELFTCEWWFNVDCSMATNYYSKNDGLFADASGPAGSGTCPSVSPGSPDTCQGAVDTCWSPGQPDGDCPNFGLCCFDGCANTCPQVDPPPRDPTPGYAYDAPKVTLPLRTTTPAALYGAPRNGRNG